MISTIITSSGPSIIPFQLSSTYSVPVCNFSSLATSRISSISPLFSKRRISLCSIRHERGINSVNVSSFDLHKLGGERWKECIIKEIHGEFWRYLVDAHDVRWTRKTMLFLFSLSFGATTWFGLPQMAYSSEEIRPNMIYEVGELFELGIQFTYLLILLGLLGVGSFFVIRQVLVRRELDLSAKELQEQVRSGDATATEYFELGAVMLRRKFYPAAIKYLQQAIDKWDGDSQDVAQVYNALGVSYVRDGKLDKGITQFENAVKQQPGYVTAWNNLGDAYEQKKELTKALNAFEEVLLFDPNNKMARPRRDALKERVKFYKGVPLKSEER